MKTRLFVLYLFFVIFAAAIIVRLFSLQVLSYEVYKSLAENQRQLFQKLIPTRGEIFIQEGRSGKTVPVVTNVEKDLVFAVPPEITEKEKTAATLAKVLEVPKSEIAEKIANNERKWVALKKELPESTSLAIKKLDLPGIYLKAETYRFYPESGLAAQVLGFLGTKGDKRVGQYGVEEYYEDLLAGQTGSLVLDRDLGGRWITGGVRKLQPAEDGADITLTLDRAIQFKADSVLKAAVEGTQADSGSMVIISPKTGAVLALANYPSFDPNEFSKVPDQGVFRNRAIADAYEPGSVFKPVTMAAGLEDGAITPDTTYEDTGSVTLGDFVIRNALQKVYGVQTMTQVLEQSINTGAIFVQRTIGKDKFLAMVKNFGFGSPTGMNLPGEAPGDINNLANGGEVHYATASFGQGITVTPLQLAQAFATIANQGKMMRPYLVDSIKYADGKEEKHSPEMVRQVMSPKTANTLAAMLVSVVENGHGKRAAVPGYYMAGKTGTAQVARSDGKGYDPDINIGSFGGFGPVEDPQFAMVVKIVRPRTVRFAESSAAPAFGQMAQFLVNYFQIPPTR